MAHIFHNTSRLNDDKCDITQRNIQNNSYSNYMLRDFSGHRGNYLNLATSQPFVNFTGYDKDGRTIDKNSDLKLSKLSRERARLNLNQRQFATVPYLGRGKSNVVLEAQLQQGELANNRKTLNHQSEISHISWHHTPMVPTLRSTVTNPNNLVEEVAQEGWIRGGVPSRELIRKNNYDN